MAAKQGNQYWKKRSKHGRRRIFQNEDELWEKCVEYFEWVENNLLKVQKLFHYRGKVITAELSKMRAMTIQGLCLHLGISEDTWANYRKRDDFLGITERVGNIIYVQKFQGAAAGLLHPNVINRELAEHSKRENRHEVVVRRNLTGVKRNS